MWRDASVTVMAKRRLRDKTHDRESKLRTLLTQLSAASKRCPFFYTQARVYIHIQIYRYLLCVCIYAHELIGVYNYTCV